MRAYFKRLCRYSLLGFFLSACLGGAAGFFLPSPEAGVKQGSYLALSSRLAGIRARFDGGDYKNIMDTVSRMGSPSNLDKETAAYNAEDFQSMGWEKAAPRLWGTEELRLFVNRVPTGGHVEEEQEMPSVSIPFPDISLRGVAFGKDGKASAVFTVGGQPEIWMWEKKNGAWTTDSVTPGYGLKEAEVSPGEISFTLFSVKDSRATREYRISASPEARLEQYRTDDSGIFTKIKGEAKTAGEGEGN
mgnify:CR=1 FL=1